MHSYCWPAFFPLGLECLVAPNRDLFGGGAGSFWVSD
jgi:hypothetical protein